MNQPNRGAPVPYTGGQFVPPGMSRRERDILLAMLWSKFGAEFVAGERKKLHGSVHVIATKPNSPTQSVHQRPPVGSRAGMILASLCATSLIIGLAAWCIHHEYGFLGFIFGCAGVGLATWVITSVS